MKGGTADRIIGVLGAAFSISYILYARTIEDSLLADEVGAAGVPTGVGVVMLLASAVLLLKSLFGLRPSGDAAAEAEPDPAAPSWRAQALALGLLAILAAYVLVLPVLGYVVSIGLLVGAVAIFAGARERLQLLACAVVTGPAFWLLFDWALQVRMPVGLLSRWLGA